MPLGRDGMYYKEFHACFDWLHHGEGLSAFLLQGLSDPDDPALPAADAALRRLLHGRRPAGPQLRPRAPRSSAACSTAAAGPLLRKATALDWAGDPIEVEGRFRAAPRRAQLRGDARPLPGLHRRRRRPPAEPGGDDAGLQRLRADRRGEVPRLAAGVRRRLGGADRGQRRHHPHATSAWTARSAASYGWYGGVYGWGFTVDQVPYTGQRAHRARHSSTAPSTASPTPSCSPATGATSTLAADARPGQRQRQEVDGRTLYPHMYGRGWGPAGPDRCRLVRLHAAEFAPGALELYYWTLDRALLDLLPAKPRWIAYLDGEDAALPGRGAASRPGAAAPAGGRPMRPTTGTPDTHHVRRPEPHSTRPRSDALDPAHAGRPAHRPRRLPAALPAALLRPGAPARRPAARTSPRWSSG